MLRILISAPYFQPVVGDYSNEFMAHHAELVIPPVHERLSEDELLKWIGEVDGVICGDDCFTQRVLSAAKRLRVISKWGTGIDSIDLDACKTHKIVVCNTPDAFSDPVADSVMAFILSFARRPWEQTEEMRNGDWGKSPLISLRECTLGIVGVGNVGKAVARRARAFGMKLLGNDIITIPQGFIKEVGIRMVEMDELLADSDYVTLNCTLNPASYHLIGQRELKLMRPTARLINTSRGPVVDENALVSALENRLIAGAALDVFEVEPLPSESRLRNMENVLLSAHNSNSSPECWKRVHDNTVRNLFENLERR